MATEREQGLAALQQGNANAAVPLLEQAVQNDPSDFQAHLILGAAYAQVNRANDAVNILTQAVHLEPANAQARYNLGIALQKAGWTNEAATAFEQALTLQPDYAQAKQALDFVRPPQVNQAQVPTTQLSPQQAPPSYQPQSSAPQQYTPVAPQQGYAPPQNPYAPPQQGYGQAPQQPYSAAPAYASLTVDSEKNRKGLLMYAYGGYGMIVMFILTIVGGIALFGSPETLATVSKGSTLITTILGIVMGVGMIQAHKASGVQQIGTAGWILLLERVVSIVTTLTMATPPPVRNASMRAFSPEQIAAAGALGVVGIISAVAMFVSLYLTCTGFLQLSMGLNNSFAEEQATRALKAFKTSGYCLLGGFGGAILGVFAPPLLILAGLVMLIGGFGFLICWVRTLMTASMLANS